MARISTLLVQILALFKVVFFGERLKIRHDRQLSRSYQIYFQVHGKLLPQTLTNFTDSP
jgi:hypothetical protein